ncbi:uncharacterized protein MELLADRAFT_107051 [Melampsora larici-populina 98AG31]|uniref:Uncharacterized protein n=1 Tax=Melampsora larici-populina (strain 98AG31 / pathotype 3-4-7) TaxID=747676 RepID=F4RNI0_MELLP|nr:uncharacterized protein MELLADRAFT_107051 [Melampsora larici-populina 98AG31]EGG06094.1 hypothetical protein MELLADRAFT_107051 [Melampsora larici-populina 98AG31]
MLRPKELRSDPASQEARIEKLREMCQEASESSVRRAAANKARFDSQFEPHEATGKSRSEIVLYAVGDKVKLRNEAHTKGEPHWFGPFEVLESDGNNVYILMDHRKLLFPHPIGGNRLKAVNIRDLNVGEAWVLPPRLLQEITKEDLRVLKALQVRLKRLVQTQEKAAPSKIKTVGCFASNDLPPPVESALTPEKTPPSPPVPTIVEETVNAEARKDPLLLRRSNRLQLKKT